MKELKELKERLCEELKEYGRKGDLSAGSLDVVDKLAHTVKNLDKIIEAYDDGYSGHYPWAYESRYSNRRDSMGRYARDGYSRDGYSRSDLTDKLRDLMNEAPDEHTRQEIKRLIDKM